MDDVIKKLKASNFLNQYKIMFFIGFVVWLGFTAYFGFNETAQSNTERVTDTIGVILMAWGILGDITQNLTIIKNTNINPEKLGDTVTIVEPNVKNT